MEVKRAIQCVKDKYEGWIGYAQSQEEVNKLGKECNEVISLLQELEKYKEIVKSIQWHIETSKKCSSEVYGWLKFIERIIQKYFPTSVKKTITIEVEGRNEADITWFKGVIKSEMAEYAKAYDYIKVNIKEEK